MRPSLVLVTFCAAALGCGKKADPPTGDGQQPPSGASAPDESRTPETTLTAIKLWDEYGQNPLAATDVKGGAEVSVVGKVKGSRKADVWKDYAVELEDCTLTVKLRKK